MEKQKEIFESASGKILRYILEHGQVTVKEIEVGLLVTRNAIRVQIDQLESQGLVGSRSVRTERGRPYRVYYVTDKGRDSLPNDYKNLARFLWQQVIQNVDPSKKEEVLNKISSLLADDFKGKITGNTVEERMERFVKLLNEQGIPAEINGQGKDSGMVEYNCPYYEVAKENPEVCAMELEMLQKVLGSPMVRREWMLEGAAGCQFKVSKPENK